MRKAVLAALLTLSLSLAAQPRLGPELALTPYENAPAPGGRDVPVAAAGPGGQLLVLWNDERLPNRYGVFGTFVSPDGRVTPEFGFELLPGFDEAFDPKAAWNGEHYVVRFHNFTGAYSMLLNADGSRHRDPIAAPVGLLAANDRHEVLSAYDGVAAVLDQNGLPDPLRRFPLPSATAYHALVGAGSGWVLVATTASGVTAMRIDGERGFVEQLPVTGSASSVDAASIDAASSGSSVAVAWTRHETSETRRNTIIGVTVVDLVSRGTTEQVLETISVPKTIEARSGYSDVAWDGRQFVASWTRVNFDGTIDLRSGVVGSAETQTLARVSNFSYRAYLIGAEGRALWVQHLRHTILGPSDFLMRPIGDGRALATTPEVRLAGAAPAQWSPRAVASANGLFAAWWELHTSEQLRVRFVGHGGNKGAMLTVTSAPATLPFDVTTTQDGFALAYVEVEPLTLPDYRTHVLVQSFDAHGQRTGAPVEVARHDGIDFWRGAVPTLAVAQDGASVIVAWRHGKDINAARITAGVAEPVRRIAIADQFLTLLDSVVTSDGPLFVWHDNPGSFSSSGVISFHRIYAADFAGSTRLLLNSRVIPLDYQFRFDVASNGDELLVVWSATSDIEPTRHCLNAQRMRPDGSRIDPLPTVLRCTDLAPAPVFQTDAFEPSAMWDGRQWWIASTGVQPESALVHTLTNGAITSATTVVPLHQHARDIAIVPAPAGPALLYRRFDPAATVQRLFLRRFVNDGRERAVRH